MRNLAIIFLALVLSGCAAITRMGVNSMAPTFSKISAVAERQLDLELAGAGMPSNLIMLEGLLEISPDNYDLLILSCKGYAGYAQGFVEGVDNERAKALYLKARDFGLRALEDNSDFKKALEKEREFFGCLEKGFKECEHLRPTISPDDVIKNMDKRYIDALFWTAIAWAGWLNLSIENTEALFDVSRVNNLMSRVMELDDTYYFGGSHLFLASYYANLPPMAGGGADKAKAEFEKVFEISDNKFLMAHIMYARYYATLMKDEELFEKEIRMVLDAPDDILPEATLANQVAKKKARKLLKEKDKYF